MSRFVAPLLLALCSAIAQAQVVLPTQGFLLGPDEQPLNGTYSLTFRLHPHPTQVGAAVWTGSFPAVEVRQGYYAVELGSAPSPVLPASVFDGTDRWIGVQVGAGPELAPRLRVGTVASAVTALVATNAQALGGEAPASFHDAALLTGTVPAGALPAATTTAQGAISAADKAKLDGLGTGARVTSVSATGPLSVGGTTAAPVISISPATTSAAGSMSAADKVKLDAVASTAVAQVGTTRPGSPTPGQLFYDTGNARLELWDGGAWRSVSGLSSLCTAGSVVYATAGSTTFTVPLGCSQLTVRAWGGGGGGAGTYQFVNGEPTGANGGGGGFTQATIGVSSGELLTVLVGGGGGAGLETSGGGAGGTGGGANGGNYYGGGGGGGGRSEVSRGSTQLVVAGGGGGGAGRNHRNGVLVVGGAGGGGGGADGQGGTAGQTATGGGAGTSTGPGGGGVGNQNGAAGSGGNGGQGGGVSGGNWGSGGGGGGGYFGGGGGANGDATGNGGGGGGGSGFVVAGSTTIVRTGATGVAAANDADTLYLSPAGRGGTGGRAGTAGQPGRIVLSWSN